MLVGVVDGQLVLVIAGNYVPEADGERGASVGIEIVAWIEADVGGARVLAAVE